MEDQQQRKRPRLDSAEAGATEISLALQETSPNKKDQYRSPSPPNLMTAMNMARSPTSKVTINTRSVQSPSQPCSQETQISEQQATTNAVDATMLPEQSPGNAQDDAISISSSSSAAKSPEIQVAEVEDFDQDDADTRWYSLSGNPNTLLGPDYVYATFPYATEQYKGPGRVAYLIPQLSKILTEDNCTEVLIKLQTWLSEFLVLQDQITPEFLQSEPGFWNDVPELISAVLRRE